MGNAGNRDDKDFPSRPIRDDEYEWEYERSRFDAWDANELAETVAVATIRRPKSGHAYLPDEIKALRDILHASSKDWHDSRLYRHTDEFAVLTGLSIRTQRDITPKDRISEINARLVKPATILIEAFEPSDFSKEFLIPWSEFKRIETDSIVAQLTELISAARAHILAINVGRGRGISWDSDLKDYFVNNVAILCEFINQDFEPTRKNQLNRAEKTMFSEAAYLLAVPLFRPNPRSNRVFLDGAIRKHVDRWNAAKKELQRQLRQK